MNLHKVIVIAISLAALPVLSSATEQTQMPMMGSPYSQQAPMDPMMMQRMMQMRQQQMQQQRMNMPTNPGMMMGGPGNKSTEMVGGMPMKGMMGDGKGGMPMMEMMKNKQAMMQAHMIKIEAHLANIEALLQQLVDREK